MGAISNGIRKWWSFHSSASGKQTHSSRSWPTGLPAFTKHPLWTSEPFAPHNSMLTCPLPYPSCANLHRSRCRHIRHEPCLLPAVKTKKKEIHPGKSHTTVWDRWNAERSDGDWKDHRSIIMTASIFLGPCLHWVLCRVLHMHWSIHLSVLADPSWWLSFSQLRE